MPSRPKAQPGARPGARSLSQRARSISSKRDLDDARRALGKGRGTATPRPIRPEDVLERYRRRPNNVGVREGSTKGSNGHASTLPRLSKKRGSTRPVRGKDATRPGRPLAPVAGDGKSGDLGRPNRPAPSKPGVGRPAAGKPKVRKPGAGKPTAGRPGAGRPIAVQPGGTKGGNGPGGRPVAGRGGPRNPLAATPGAAGKRYERRLRSARPIGPRGVTGGPLTEVGNRPARPRSSGTQVGGVWANSSGWTGQGSYFGNCHWNTWGNCYGNTWGSWLCSPLYLSGFWWDCYWRRGGNWGFGLNWNRGLWSPWRNCYWYGPSLPASVSVVVYDDPEPEPEVVYIEEPEPEIIYVDGTAPLAGDVQPVGGMGAVPAPAHSPGDPAIEPEASEGIQRELSRAAAYYLSQGDRAFRETRYGDAVHAYAKAVEFAPESGILYLVLSDALFATGDYRYAAFALRQAAEREPALFENVVDKREFYAEPGEFEAQLAILERYVRDHVLDVDARLVLSANYLFGGRPEFALEVLENPFSEELRGTEIGGLMTRVARSETGQ